MKFCPGDKVKIINDYTYLPIIYGTVIKGVKMYDSFDDGDINYSSYQIIYYIKVIGKHIEMINESLLEYEDNIINRYIYKFKYLVCKLI